MKISNKLSLALGMKSNKFPPPFFNRFNENGVPNYYKNKGQKIIGINEYLPDDYDYKIWKKTNTDKEFLKRKKRKIVEKNESPIDNEEIEKEINKHIRKAVPIYEDIIENIID